ncbi:MAG TPA: DegV family protein [Acholeplasmataceae bacterium]|jgi:DegV family protein with EDD domain|nr:DegV family protein [Acholeplasmataceae bacterium]
METKIAILTDSSSSIYSINHSMDNLFMIDIPCFIGDNIFTDFEKNGDEPFNNALRSTKLLPKTSQPSTGALIAKYEEIKSKGFTHIIFLPLSQKLSGTYQSGLVAKEMVDGINIEVLDTNMALSILAGIAIRAAKLAKKTNNVEEIIEEVKRLRNNSGYFLTVNDLTSLIKNGRLANRNKYLINFLRIKPVITLTDDGLLLAIKQVRTYKKALNELCDLVLEKVNPTNSLVQISCTYNVNDLQYCKEILLTKCPKLKIVECALPATATAHFGLDSIGIGYINY